MTAQPQISRPAIQLARPTLVDPAFADPTELMRLFELGAPYKTLAAAQKDGRDSSVPPWFRNFWALGGKLLFADAEAAFHNPLLIEAAKAAFNADIVIPHALMTNLNLPSPATEAHLDLPFFRGAHQREVPSWLLAPMGYSGLFQQWAIPVASAITWCYDGDGGEFEYWADGFDYPSTCVAAQSHNQAVVADNEYMYHHVRQVGRPDQFLPGNKVPATSYLHLENDEWVVIDGDTVIARFGRAEVRLSMLWKAFCFRDQAEAEAYTNGTDNLTPDAIVDIFQKDLQRKGINVERPTDLKLDQPWANAIRSTYVPAKAPVHLPSE